MKAIEICFIENIIIRFAYIGIIAIFTLLYVKKENLIKYLKRERNEC